MKILHIAVHLGGGVGTVLKNWIKKDIQNNHTVLLLNHNYFGELQEYIYENLRSNYEKINDWIKNSDIVIIHFWNHPMLFEFLINANLTECRVCIWSHVSALTPPYVHVNKLVKFSDKFILSSPISNIKEVDIKLCTRIKIIWTTGGIEDYILLKKVQSENTFLVGYIGTLDYSKINKHFVSLCENIYKEIPSVKFIICGSGCDADKIKIEVNQRNLDHIFNFTGIIDIKTVISTFDVFGYPLTNSHFGTCEQVLGETMACGIEPVVFNNPAEKYIVKDLGKICYSFDDYIRNIVSIYKNPTSKLCSDKLVNRAIELYDINKMIDDWNELFRELIQTDKTKKMWDDAPINKDGYNIYIESLGECGEILKRGTINEIKTLFNSNDQ